MSERTEKALRAIITILGTICVIFMESVLVPIVFIYCSYNAIVDKDIEYLTDLREAIFDVAIGWFRFISHFYRTGEIDYTYLDI